MAKMRTAVSSEQDTGNHPGGEKMNAIGVTRNPKPFQGPQP
jgi:hypothetical protein